MVSRQVTTDRYVAQMCRADYKVFFHEMWDTVCKERFKSGWHIDKLCEELQVMAERVFEDKPKEYDLIWNCPPGTTKSLSASVLWQPWTWTRMPSFKVISGSFSERLSLDLARKSRDCVLSEKYQRLFPEIQLRDDQNTKSYFATDQGGWRYATGVGGSVMGMHAHAIVIDDPVDPLQVLSDLDLATANVWMDESLDDRKVDKEVTPTITIMQRLHQDDPTGHQVERGGRLKHVVLPAEDSWPIKPAEWRTYYKDGLLDPVRLTRAILEEKMRRGEAFYAGQFGQQPVPRGGAMFKVDRIQVKKPFDIPTKWKRGPVRYWDKACLLPYTQIETLTGVKAIKDVIIGDRVRTRWGWKKVLRSGPTKRVTKIVSVLFSNGSVVSGTSDHLIWTENRDWVPLASLRHTDYNVSLPIIMGSRVWEGDQSGPQIQKSLCSMGSLTHVVLDDVTSKHDAGTKPGRNTSTNPFTRLCGSSTGGPSPVVMMFTTLTTTRVITTLQILSASHTEVICKATGPDGKLTQVAKSLQRWLPGPKQLPVEESWFVKDSSNGNECSQSLLSALSAGKLSKGKLLTVGLGTVEESVEPKLIEGDGVPVYDLTVEDDHEFFADGILVHNCTQGGGAFTAGVKMGLDEDERIWILDSQRFQLDSGRRENTIMSIARVDSKKTRVGIEQEPSGSGKESAEIAAKRYSLKGFRVYIDPVRGDKESRADAFSVQVNIGNVNIVEGPWNKAFLEEMRYFPASKYKDQIDAASGAYSMLTKARIRIGVL